MKKHTSGMMCMAKWIACGIIVGSALGTAAAVMLKMNSNQRKKKMPMCLREKAAEAMDTIGSVMQNLADMTR